MGTARGPDEVQIVEWLQSDEKELRERAMQVWYQRDREDLKRVIRSRCSREPWYVELHVEDIVQKAFMIAFRQVRNGKYKDRGKHLIAYLIGIAKNLIRDIRRNDKRHAQRLYYTDDNGDEQERPFEAEEPSVDDKIDRERALRIVGQEIERLSIREQRALVLYKMKGLTSQEVAERLGLTAGNVRQIVRRTIAKLRERPNIEALRETH